MYHRFGKRLLDVVLSAIGIVVLAPVIGVVTLLVRCCLGTPVLFRQQRPGLHDHPFTLLKFRSMTDSRNHDGSLQSDAERLTRFGKFLRSSSLDEIPELINVLRGDMSLVGPRPLLMAYLDRYTPEQRRRHDVKPGITGWAQISGRNGLAWKRKFELDVWYIDHQSLWLDLRILGLTIRQVLKREDISQPGHATMERFK